MVQQVPVGVLSLCVGTSLAPAGLLSTHRDGVCGGGGGDGGGPSVHPPAGPSVQQAAGTQ
jgi:hypothetical protein